MEQKIDLGSLKAIGILYEDDLHDPGQFVLRPMTLGGRGQDPKLGRRSTGWPGSMR